MQYVEAGQEGMITDAQAAELLMRVSEQRPVSLQSLQQDAAASGGPYVQVQAQTVEGITHLVEVPVSALAGYCLPSTLVYSTPSGTVGSGGGEGEMATWTVMETSTPSVTDSGQQGSIRMENKFSDIVSASIEAIGFPESVTPGANILSQAEQILIASDSAGGQTASDASANNFEFDESSNSSLTLINDKSTTTYPRPKRESIESRIHRLLRGANAPVPESSFEDQSSPTSGMGKTTPQKNVKLTQLQSRPTSTASSSPSTVTLSLPKRTGRLDTTTSRSVAIPTVFTATNQSSAKTTPLPPGSSDYFMPRGMSKRKAQPFKPSKISSSKPGCIDADPAPPEETKVNISLFF